MLGTYHLTALFDILQKIHFLYQPDKLWKFVLEESSKVLQTEAGTFYEVSKNGEELVVSASVGVNESRLSEAPFRIGTGLCGWVAHYQQPALVNDVRSDQRFNRAVDLMTGFRTKAVLCVPIFSQQRTYGVLELMNKRNAALFGPQDQEFMTMLGRQAAIAYQNLLFLAEISETKGLLQSVLNSLTGGLVTVNQAGRITLINPAACRILHLSAEAAPGQDAKEIFKSYPQLLEIIEQTRQSKTTVSRQEVQLKIREAEERVGYTTILVADPHNAVLGAGLIFQLLEPK